MNTAFLIINIKYYIFILDLGQYICKSLEHWETDPWAIDEILKCEILTRQVIDPNCGSGILSKAAFNAGYDVIANDIYDYGYEGQSHNHDFLSDKFSYNLGGI